jgi:hypothetical protein
MIAISFYTSDGAYPRLADRLRASCEAVGLKNKIVQGPSRETWHRTINMKAAFILQNLLDAREPVLWLDCDCVVRKFPALLCRNEHDFAIYNWCMADHQFDGTKLLNSGGVSYWGYTAPAIELLVRWSAACHANPAAIDDQTLDAVWKEHRPPVKPFWLPKTYNWMCRKNGVEDLVIRREFGPEPADCVIWHDYCGGKHREAV